MAVIISQSLISETRPGISASAHTAAGATARTCAASGPIATAAARASSRSAAAGAPTPTASATTGKDNEL